MVKFLLAFFGWLRLPDTCWLYLIVFQLVCCSQRLLMCSSTNAATLMWTGGPRMREWGKLVRESLSTRRMTWISSDHVTRSTCFRSLLPWWRARSGQDMGTKMCTLDQFINLVLSPRILRVIEKPKHCRHQTKNLQENFHLNNKEWESSCGI